MAIASPVVSKWPLFRKQFASRVRFNRKADVWDEKQRQGPNRPARSALTADKKIATLLPFPEQAAKV
jgi:hypothetical protein